MGIKSMEDSSQQMSSQKKEYIQFVQQTNNLLTIENSTCKEFKNITEQFLIDSITAEAYIANVQNLYNSLSNELQQYKGIITSNIEVYDVKSLSTDYMNITLNAMNNILNNKNKTSMEIKQVVLYYLNDNLASRENQFTNLLALINENSKKYNIESEINLSTIYFNISFE